MSKKIITLALATTLVIYAASTSAIAQKSESPCLKYGYDPDEIDTYDTYGDTYFLDQIPMKTPSGDLYIYLNSHATKNIISASEEYGSVAHIINEDYFPELNIADMLCSMTFPGLFELGKDSYLQYDSELLIEIKLEDNSKESVRNALIALAPRADIDISSVIHRSYDLMDVSNALKYIAGWGSEYNEPMYNFDRVGDIELSDVSYMLKVIAGWDVPTTWEIMAESFGEVTSEYKG